MKISPARIAAFDILLKIETENAFSSVLLPLHEVELSDKDKALCHQLTLGVLRRKIYFDTVISKATEGKKLDAAVAVSIRMGLFQMLFLDKVPDYSAVSESVNLVQRAKKTSAKGLVNAVLRRIGREGVALDFVDEIERVSVETSHPRWLVERWIGQFGTATAFAIANANNEIPGQAFRVTAKGRSKGILPPPHASKSHFVDGCYFAATIDDEIKRQADACDIYFQDEASQIVASAVELKDEDKFLDVCAAPGSKTTMVASSGSDTLIAAGDINAARAKFLRKNCINQGVETVQVVRYDAEKALPFADEDFNSVLVDAPCSGTGTIRHNPEIRYFLKTTDFEDLQKKQLAILQNASKMVKRGGTLIYSTCSLEREENEAVIEKFRLINQEFEIGSAATLEKFRTSDGFYRTFPNRDKMDGFFIALLIRSQVLRFFLITEQEEQEGTR